jgi:hypothetical protein
MSARFAAVALALASAALTVSAATMGAAPAGRYAIANGTVSDAKTALTWQQSAPSGTYTWAAAKSYCASLSLGGAGAWRVPTVKELQTLVDVSERNPSIDPTAFPNTSSSAYWSSSPLAGSSSATAWYVFFSYGYVYYDAVSSAYNVRCVR